MTSVINWFKQLITAYLGYAASPPDIKDGKAQAWYGRVNTWAQSKSNLTKDLDAMSAAGVSGYMIEMAGWANPNAWTPKWLKDTEEMYKFLLAGCRARGMWLFVSVVNDNQGSRKYGDLGIPLSVVMPMAQQLVNIIKDNGKDNVIVQPVAETRTGAGRQIEQYCLQTLGGFPLVYNGGSRPGGIPAGFKYRAWHPYKVTDVPPRDTVVVSDTGSIITLLGEGLSGKGKPAVIQPWVSTLKNSGIRVIGYYAFLFNGHDKDAIKAMGKGIK